MFNRSLHLLFLERIQSLEKVAGKTIEKKGYVAYLYVLNS